MTYISSYSNILLLSICILFWSTNFFTDSFDIAFFSIKNVITSSFNCSLVLLSFSVTILYTVPYISIISSDIPDSIGVIGEYAFSNCSTLNKVNNFESIKVFNAYVFMNTGLTEIVLNDVDLIAEQAKRFAQE